MGKMKAFAEKISVEMGYGGALTPEVLKEANRILQDYGLTRHYLELPEKDLEDEDWDLYEPQVE